MKIFYFRIWWVNLVWGLFYLLYTAAYGARSPEVNLLDSNYIPRLKLKPKADSIKNYAIFFAVKDYPKNPKLNLKNPIKDATALAGVLAGKFGFDTIVYRNPTKKTIETELESLQKRFTEKTPTYAQLFIFFTGHGEYRKANLKSYFLPSNAQSGKYDTFIDLSDIGNRVVQIKNPHILLALDFCYSGGIDPEIIRQYLESKTKETRADSLFSQSSKSIEDELKRPRQDSIVKLTNQLLLLHLKKQSRLFISSGKLEPTEDGVVHSPFAEAIMNAFLEKAQTNKPLTYHQLLGALDYIIPKPHTGRMLRDGGGGFVFIPKELDADLDYYSIKESPTFKDGASKPYWGKISGYVRNRIGERQAGVKVFGPQNTNAITNENGYFELNVPKSNLGYRLTISTDGYRTRTITFPNLKSNYEVILDEN